MEITNNLFNALKSSGYNLSYQGEVYKINNCGEDGGIAWKCYLSEVSNKMIRVEYVPINSEESLSFKTGKIRKITIWEDYYSSSNIIILDNFVA